MSATGWGNKKEKSRAVRFGLVVMMVVIWTGVVAVLGVGGYMAYKHYRSPEAVIVSYLDGKSEILKAHMDDQYNGHVKAVEYDAEHLGDAIKAVLDLKAEIAAMDAAGERQERIDEIEGKVKMVLMNYRGYNDTFNEKLESNKEVKKQVRLYDKMRNDRLKSFDVLDF